MTDRIKLVCSACNAINQFDISKPALAAKCGKCKQKLVPDTPVEVDHATLGRHLANSGIPVLVDFWAPWCGPCRSFAPTYQQYAKNNAGKILCLKLDTEANQQAGMQYRIRSIPTLALFINGKEIQRISGAMNESQLARWVQQNVAG